MYQHLFLIIKYALLSSVLAVAAYAEGKPNKLKLREYLTQIQNGDPTVEAARFRWEASEDAVPAAGTLPDPNVRYGYFLANVETRVGNPGRRTRPTHPHMPLPETL